MRSPIFEQIKENDEMFDDQSNWITPSKYIHMYIIIKLLHDLFLATFRFRGFTFLKITYRDHQGRL